MALPANLCQVPVYPKSSETKLKFSVYMNTLSGFWGHSFPAAHTFHCSRYKKQGKASGRNKGSSVGQFYVMERQIYLIARFNRNHFIKEPRYFSSRVCFIMPLHNASNANERCGIVI
jgi:hypothetical protein